MHRPLSFALVVAAACGPTIATDDDATTDAPQVTSSSSAASTSSDTTDTDAAYAACVAADPADCPPDCYAGFALQVIDDACGTTSVEVCLPAGPKPGLPLAITFWANAPSGPVFAEYGGPCSVGARPDVWRECSGAANEPADCACFCQGGYCPGDEDRRALEDCGLAVACDPLFVDPQFGAVDHDAEACVLAGLAARTEGVYELTTSDGFTTTTTRFYVFGDDEVARIELTSDDVQSCPQRSDWGSASTCTLASPDYFASCMGPLTEAEDCVLDLDAWSSECADGVAQCG